MVNTFFLLCYLLRIGVAKCTQQQKRIAFTCLLAFTEAAGAHESELLVRLLGATQQVLEPIWHQVAPLLKANHLLWSGSVACALWCLALGPTQIAQEWAPKLLIELAVHMELFAIGAVQPAVQVIAARWQKGKKRSRRMSHVLRSHLNTTAGDFRARSKLQSHFGQRQKYDARPLAIFGSSASMYESFPLFRALLRFFTVWRAGG